MTIKNMMTGTLLVLGCALGLQQQAVALDENTFSAHACRANNKTSNQDLSYNAAGVTNNNATSNRFVVCTLFRDAQEMSANSNNMKVQLWGKVAAGGKLTCTAYLKNLVDNATIDSGVAIKDNTGGGSTVNAALTMNVDDNGTHPYRYGTLVCTLPPNSSIAMYYLSQETI